MSMFHCNGSVFVLVMFVSVIRLGMDWLLLQKALIG